VEEPVQRAHERTREHPQADAIAIQAKQIREATDRPVRIGAQPYVAVPQVLSRVVRGVADQRLRRMI
jgi:hypothetical protein